MTYRDNAQTLEDLSHDLDDLRDFFADVDNKIAVINSLRERYTRPFELSRVIRSLYPGDPGLCRTCGLPKTEDIDHNPPDNPMPKGDVEMKVWQTYNAEQRKRFLAALEGLSNERLAGVGIANRRFFSFLLRDVVKKRLEDVEARHQVLLEERRLNTPTRWDLINDDAE